MERANNLVDEVQELVWALVDDYATERQIHRLEELLLENDEARRTYVTCMQLHADLHFMLNPNRPRLPEEVERAIAARQSAAPLPAVDPPVDFTVQFPDAFA